MSTTGLHDGLVEYLRAHPGGVCSRELAERVLKFKNPEQKLAHRMISAILQKDRRCRLGQDEKWFPVAVIHADEDCAIRDMPWTAVWVLADTEAGGGRILYVSVWNIFETPANLFSGWASDPSALSAEEREMMCGPFDAPYEGREQTIQKVLALLENRAPVFLTARHQGVLTRDGLLIGESLTDDTMLMSTLMRMCGMTVPRPMTLEACCQTVFNRPPAAGSAYRFGECFAECVWEALRRIMEQGIVTRRGLDSLEAEKMPAAPWAAASFSLSDIADIPQAPGVYGFKDRGGKFIYIGKAKNLRRRLKSYFRYTDETRRKLTVLRAQAHTLTVHRCGSELESLILEYRLIRKHAPALNTQISIGERRGHFSPVPDCIILLPHADDGKGMSVWLRREQKAVLKPFDTDFRDSAGLIEHLNAFFFGPPPAPEKSDFPELEIIHRWVKRHEDSLTMVPVSRCSSAGEALEWMKSAWEDMQAFRPAS